MDLFGDDQGAEETLRIDCADEDAGTSEARTGLNMFSCQSESEVALLMETINT